MSFNFGGAEQKKGNFRGKCIYLLMLIKQKNQKVWERLNGAFKKIKMADTYDFYQTLLREWKQLEESGGKDLGPVEKSETATSEPKYKILTAEQKAGEDGQAKKAPVKKSNVQKVAKESEDKDDKKSTKPAKKTTKKIAKKASSSDDKKAAKKKTKKTAKKAAKKTTKSSTTKKKKTTGKKTTKAASAKKKTAKKKTTKKKK